MTAQASRRAAAPSAAPRVQPRRWALAPWATVLTLLAALLGAGVCMTATLPDVYPVIALAH